jgi:hypothetical protein
MRKGKWMGLIVCEWVRKYFMEGQMVCWDETASLNSRFCECLGQTRLCARHTWGTLHGHRRAMNK